MGRWKDRVRWNLRGTYFDHDRVGEILGAIYLHALTWPLIDRAWAEIPELLQQQISPQSEPPHPVRVVLMSASDEADARKEIHWHYEPVRTPHGSGHMLIGEAIFNGGSGGERAETLDARLDLFQDTHYLVAQALLRTQHAFSPEAAWQWTHALRDDGS